MIVAQKHNGAIVPQRLGDPQPRQPELVFQRFRPTDVIDRLRQVAAPLIADRRVRAGQKIVGEGLDAEAGHLCNIRVGPARGIVRQEQIPAADGAHIAQELQRPVEERFA